MSTAEQLAFSIQIERHGIHMLIWDDQHDLVRSLLILQGAIVEVGISPILVPTSERELAILCNRLYESRTEGNALKMLFVPQAANATVGPWLNGARFPLSQPPGTLLVVRDPDLQTFQSCAPDLTSFVGPRIYSSASMLSLVTSATYKRMKCVLSNDFMEILENLPGTRPAPREIESWFAALDPGVAGADHE